MVPPCTKQWRHRLKSRTRLITKLHFIERQHKNPPNGSAARESKIDCRSHLSTRYMTGLRFESRLRIPFPISSNQMTTVNKRFRFIFDSILFDNVQNRIRPVSKKPRKHPRKRIVKRFRVYRRQFALSLSIFDR